MTAPKVDIAPGAVLVINAGSSSLKYQLTDPHTEQVYADGLAERIGEPIGSAITHEANGRRREIEVALPDHAAAIATVAELLREDGIFLRESELAAVGHRVVHGGRTFHAPTVIDDEVCAEIERIAPLAPLHNPPNLVGIEVVSALLPDVPAVGIFDTAFFHDLPADAATYALDAEVAQKYAIRRYGFHGTSHQYVSRRAAEFLGRDYGDVNQIVLHLGNGASASAIRGGRPIDTSMGMTPLEGLVMGTRTGDIDPGIAFQLARVGGMSIDEIDHLYNKRSGLKGLSGDNDFRAILERVDAGDEAAALAYQVYLHRLRHYLGAYMIELGRVDAVVFTAGVGENAASVRADALARLEMYGIEIDPDRNEVRSPEPRRISTDASAVAVLVVPTNEELEIAHQAAAVVAGA
ncbi:acetate kinase [Gordonia sp. PP30]|uniref:acetate kinase n=1 Tax=unclassified Gordonia (in: high G+C Gram-positive bacteria) TaxID=2657482 RepID=UPI001FFE518D|nr:MULTISPECIES: acetate kinase [unclassified Gordonia (in: high G+C Gram-positive bacteria)]UQE74861.1 acetate kinase [Gordonia sp. PP30]